MKKMDDLKVSVGVSEMWDAKSAGIDVARKTLNGIGGKKPDFFLLFSTIHYKNYGGFQEFLNGVNEILPVGTILIGGTITGFISKEGCFVHGACAMAVSYPNMDIVTGIGRNTRRDPKKSANDCANMIKEGLKKSKYQNKFLIDLISGPTIPKVPGFGRVNYVKDKKIGNFMVKKGMDFAAKLGYGIGKEEDVVDELASIMPDFNIIGGSSADDGKFLGDFQFIGNKVFTESIVALGGCIDREVLMEAKTKVPKYRKTVKITETVYGSRIITKINNKPAKEEFFKAMGIFPEQFRDLDAFYYRTSDYFLLTFDEENQHSTGTGAILGDNILLGHKVRGDKMIISCISGNEIKYNFSSLLEKQEHNLSFMFGISSAIVDIFIMGNKVYNIKNVFDKKFKDVPYLVLQPILENGRIVGKKPFARGYSILNSLSF